MDWYQDKYKAKSTVNGHWVYGVYLRHINRTPCPMNDSIKPQDIEHLIIHDGFSDWNMPRGVEVEHILPETLCRYAFKQDVCAKELFTGDVITINAKPDKYVIDFDVERSCFILKPIANDSIVYDLSILSNCECMYVGNIYDDMKDGEQNVF